MAVVNIVPIDRQGRVQGLAAPGALSDVLAATRAHYQSAGHEPPWIGYLALDERTPVGVCSFKGPPAAGRVEIAYFTLPGFAGRGYASAMAAQLIDVAARARPELVVVAQTLRERNASHRVLEKLGFEQIGVVQHPEDGEVLEWRRSAR